MNPLVSCIITCYNQQEFLDESISSVLSQTYQNIELIIVDDDSTDDSQNAIRKYEAYDHVKIILNQHCGLPAVTRNVGIKVAKGKFVSFLDADDYWRPDKIEKQLMHFENEEIIGVGSSAILFGDMRFHRQRRYSEDELLDLEGILARGSIRLSSLMVRNDGFLINECIEYKYIEDFDFQLKLVSSTNKKLKRLAEPLIYYRIHPAGGSNDLNKAQNAIKVASTYRHLISDRIYHQFCFRQYFTLGTKSLRAGVPQRWKFFSKAYCYGTLFNKLVSAIMVVVSFLPSSLIFWGLGHYYSVRRFLEPDYEES